MPSFHRASFNPALLKPVEEDGVDRAPPHDAAVGPSPWPWRVAVPLIAGLSLALWVGVVRIIKVLGAG